MIYLRACFHRYLIFIIPAFLLGLPFYYFNDNFNFKILLLYFVLVLSLGITAILYRKIYKLRQYAPLKKYLEMSKIETNEKNLDPIYLSFIMSLSIFTTITLWLYLSIFGDFYFFIYTLSILLIIFISFQKRIRIYDKLVNFLVISILTLVLPVLMIFELGKIKIELFNIFDIISICLIISSIVILKDIKNIFQDHNLEKQTLPNTISVEKSKMLIILLSIFVYILIIMKLIALKSAFFFIPLFSAPLLINILLKIHKNVGNNLNTALNMFYIYIIFHSFLIFSSNIFTILRIL
jgi:hypothetical protein